MILPVRNPNPPWDTEAAPQRYRIYWSADSPKTRKEYASGSLVVKVKSPLYNEWMDERKHKHNVRMNIRAQAMHRADGYLRKTYPSYAQASARVLRIEPIGEED